MDYQRLILFLCLLPHSSLSHQATSKRLLHSFETDFDGWNVSNGSWERVRLKSLEDHDTAGGLPSPKELNSINGSSKNEYVLVPSKDLDDSFGIMRKDFVVEGPTNFEIYFSALALGWKDEQGFDSSWKNPHLEVLYDDVRVFQLSSAIRENKDYFSPNKWNQFRLLSSYSSSFNLTISILGKKGRPTNLLALDNIILKEISHKAITKPEFEPETDVKETDGAWERLVSTLEEHMNLVSSNHSIKAKPEFCDLNEESGPCDGSWARFYYNRTTKSCETFSYGGCNGNSNNFKSKEACESICKRPSQSEDDTLLKEKKKCHSLHLDLEKDLSNEEYDGWTIQHFTRIGYANQTLNVSRNNIHSDFGISPDYDSNTVLRRPTLLHPIDLIPNMELCINFSLILIGDVDMRIHPFFEHLNPSFKVYVGDMLLFDFLSAGTLDMQWHNYSVCENTNAILDSPDLTNYGHEEQILRIESWKGSALDESEVVILDDFLLVQNKPPIRSRTTMTPSSEEDPTSTPQIQEELEPTTIFVNYSDGPCDRPLDPGPCHSNISRFYFDSTSRECRLFEYGGCKGNGNRFKSREACLNLCASKKSEENVACTLPLDHGYTTCNAYAEKYFYNDQLDICMVFLYSGCGGNANRFTSATECQRKCMATKEDSIAQPKKTFLKTVDTVVHESSNKSCLQNVEKGPCRGNYNAFGYDPKKEDCVRFVYGGCGGNDNRFYTREKCRNSCQAHVSPSRCSDALLETKEGSTCSKDHRYFYDSGANTCRGGCPSRDQNKGFWSKGACEHHCLRPSCQLPFSIRFTFICYTHNQSRRYYFDPHSHTCKEHCLEGNDKLFFHSKEQCSSACVEGYKKERSSKCGLPKDEGSSNCGGFSSDRFYFDNERGACDQMTYLGCGGNGNNFKELGSCLETCIPTSGRSLSGLNGPTIAEIVLGIIVAAIFAIAAFFGWKYFRIQRNYGLFRNESRSSSLGGPGRSVVIGTAYDNPTYNTANADRSHLSTDNIQLKAPSSSNTTSEA